MKLRERSEALGQLKDYWGSGTFAMSEFVMALMEEEKGRGSGGEFSATRLEMMGPRDILSDPLHDPSSLLRVSSTSPLHL